MDFFVLPSWSEGFCIAVMEALVNGVKCYINDRITEVSSISKNIKTISLKKKPKYWAQTIYQEHNHTRQPNTENQIFNYFSIEKVIEKLTEIYEK